MKTKYNLGKFCFKIYLMFITFALLYEANLSFYNFCNRKRPIMTSDFRVGKLGRSKKTPKIGRYKVKIVGNDR